MKGAGKGREWGQQWEQEEEGLKILITNLEYTPGAEGANRAEPGLIGRAMESAGTSSLEAVSFPSLEDTETDH